MTVNQFEYAQLEQTRLRDAETQRHNAAMESVELGKLAEAKRHQLATEATERSRISEVARHDYVSEGLSQLSTNLNYETQSIASKASASQASTAKFRSTIDAMKSFSDVRTNKYKANTERMNTIMQGRAATTNAMTNIYKTEVDKQKADIAQQEANIKKVGLGLSTVSSLIKALQPPSGKDLLSLVGKIM